MEAQAGLAACTLCPRQCGAHRLDGERGVCGSGRHAAVCSAGPHFGEETPLVGSHGSGTIFISGCNLLCLFCQNFEIMSQYRPCGRAAEVPGLGVAVSARDYRRAVDAALAAGITRLDGRGP
jgi:putative pyruvate formate lyase activating enzyme